MLNLWAANPRNSVYVNVQKLPSNTVQFRRCHATVDAHALSDERCAEITAVAGQVHTTVEQHCIAASQLRH